MAPRLNFDREENQVLFSGSSAVKLIILNRPLKLNSLNHEMELPSAYANQITNNLSNIGQIYNREDSSTDVLGSRVKMIDKGDIPKWKPSIIELVSEEMVDQYFGNVNDEEWECLRFPDRSNSQIQSRL
ncbi:hypothetical protein V8G54_012298 [Vigna mungo]|uniref:3-hydroxyisobutyryl-CoA hydrolase n=1 Tax=Vigna mungo TaxID=3915 RepID=A0AAQ3S264_VIGMU